jgi:hypothetical protein
MYEFYEFHFILSHSFAALIERLRTADNHIDRLLIDLIRSVRNFCLYLHMFTFYSRFESLTAIESIKSSRADNGVRCFVSTKWFQTTWLGPRKVLLNYFPYMPAYWIYFITFWQNWIYDFHVNRHSFVQGRVNGFLKCHCRVHACVSVCV